MNKEFILAIEQLEKEKEISKEIVLEALESALASAYKKNYGSEALNSKILIDTETGEISVITQLSVVEQVENPMEEISLEDARAISMKYQLGDIVEKSEMPKDFGRIAAQTAKQVVVQRIKEAERDMVFTKYNSLMNDMINGSILRENNGTYFVDLGKTEGILPVNEQVKHEHFLPNQRAKFYVIDVRKTAKGPQIFLSRSHPGLVKRLFEFEVPEIYNGEVVIKSIAREAGSRTKISVMATSDKLDPIGSCVGSKGNRVQSIVDEIFGEKIDIILWSEEPGEFIKSALSPAKVSDVVVNEKERSAYVVVPDTQLSLAIGKEGQNVRLAAKLTGWKIDIKSTTQYETLLEEMPMEALVSEEEATLIKSLNESEGLESLGINARIINALNAADIFTLEEIQSKTSEEIKHTKSIGPKSFETLIEALKEKGIELS